MDLSILYKNIFNAVADGGMQSIIDEAYSCLQMPIMVCDVGFKVLAGAPRIPIGDQIWDQMMDQGHATMDMVMKFHEDKYMEAVSKYESPYYVNWGICKDYPRIQGNISINGTVEGYVGVICHEENYTPLCKEAVNIITKACTIEMKRSNVRNIIAKPLFKVFVDELFHDKIKTEKQISTWESNLGKPIRGEFCMLAIQPQSTDSISDLKYLLKSLEDFFPYHFSLIEENTLYFVLYMVNNNKRATHFNSKLVDLLTNFHAYCGISNYFSSILQFSSIRYQAKKALEMGLLKSKKTRIYFYKDYYLETILSYPLENLEKVSYLSPIIPFLDEYDKENGTEYLQTLRIYVMEICDNAKVSEILHIHRNTLLYRLHKIEELINCSITEKESYTHLLLSFHMMQMEENIKSASYETT